MAVCTAFCGQTTPIRPMVSLLPLRSRQSASTPLSSQLSSLRHSKLRGLHGGCWQRRLQLAFLRPQRRGCRPCAGGDNWRTNSGDGGGGGNGGNGGKGNGRSSRGDGRKSTADGGTAADVGKWKQKPPSGRQRKPLTARRQPAEEPAELSDSAQQQREPSQPGSRAAGNRRNGPSVRVEGGSGRSQLDEILSSVDMIEIAGGFNTPPSLKLKPVAPQQPGRASEVLLAMLRVWLAYHPWSAWFTPASTSAL